MGKTLEWKERFTTIDPVPRQVGREFYWDAWWGVWRGFTPFYSPASGTKYDFAQRTLSMGHPGPPYREGGPFVSFRNTNESYDIRRNGVLMSRDGSRRYEGGFCCAYHYETAGPAGCDVTTMGSDALTEDYGDPSPYGATAWSRYAPGRSAADLAVFLAELKDLPRQLKTSARFFRDMWKAGHGRGSTKAMAEHWLNHQFGWIPFVHDIRKFIRAYKDAESMYARVVANNGKWKRCGGTVTVDETEDVFYESNVSAHFPQLSWTFYPASGGGTGTRKLIDVSYEKVWFDAAFRYYIPNVRSVEFRRRYMASLFGAGLTPEVLWELTPWSWLVDWFSNVGDIVSNLSNGWADNLVAKYAYVMAHTEHRIDVKSTMNLWNGTIEDTWSTTFETKRRAGASPFGFSLTWDDFTPRQASILTALGITRS